MIQKIITKRKSSDVQSDLAYWLSKMPEERVAAVDYLRKQYYGITTRLQRVARVIQRPSR